MWQLVVALIYHLVFIVNWFVLGEHRESKRVCYEIIKVQI